MTSKNGYAGKILKVDLSTGSSETISTFAYTDRFLGGRGVATKIYWDEVSPETGAFDGDNRLILSLGPLAGISALGGSRWGIYAKSPFPSREHFCYGNLGGFFGAELKFAGYDGLVVRGKAEQPVTLSIHDDDIRLIPAENLWGKSTVEAMETLKNTPDIKGRVMTIGPAGENCVPFATIFADGDASCSGGLGAVMGSKNLKAVTVKGSHRRVEFADPDALRMIEKQLRGYKRGNVKVWGMDFMAHGPKTKKLPCYGCMAHCLRVRYTADNGKSGKFMCQSRFFYMAHAWGYYGEENDVPFLANRICDEYGIDTWSVQAIMEWLLLCFSAGVLTEKESGLPFSKAGSLEFIQVLVRQIAEKQGIGELLKSGTAAAAHDLGKEAAALLNHNDPYDPRYCTVNTLLFPFETREPIQQLHEAGLVLSQWSSWAKGVEEAHISSKVVEGIARRFWGGKDAGNFSTLRGKAEAAKRIQHRQYAKECIGLCDWMFPVIDIPNGEDHVGDPALESRIVSAAVGKNISEEELNQVGERVFNLQRAILVREGHEPLAEDVLPKEWHDKPLETHVADPDCIVPGKGGKIVSRIGERLDRPSFEKLREDFYRLRGWDVPSGLQSVKSLNQLSLPEAARDLAARGLAPPRSRRIPMSRRFSRLLRSLRGPGMNIKKTGGRVPPLAEPACSEEELMEILVTESGKYNDSKIAHNFKGWNKAMQYYFPDRDEHYVIRFVEGMAQEPEKRDAPIPKPDIIYEMNTAVLKAMSRGDLNGLQAYQQRKLKLKASFTDMMKLQSLNKL